MSLSEKVDMAIDNLREWCPEQGYYLCFSGGKDSIVLKQLAVESGVKFDAHYNVTTIDPPELIRYIRQRHPEVVWERPETPMFAMIPRRGLPTRMARWCCEVYKEHGGNGRFRLLGVRAAESPRRKKQWKMVSVQGKTKGKALSPILYWSDVDVWDFIRDRKLPYCSLYDEGFKRLGCVGCPAAPSRQAAEFKRWPRYEKLWRKAFHQVWERRAGSLQKNGRPWMWGDHYENPDDAFDAWKSGNYLPDQDDQECGMGLW
jgi:phosphoadenosine phosphosulfate reductase